MKMSNINELWEASEAFRMKNLVGSDFKFFNELEHGKKVLEENLKRFGFSSLSQAIQYSDWLPSMCFEHVPAGKSIEILMVAEKPSFARAVAKILSEDDSYDCNGQGRETEHNFRCRVFGRTANVRMVSTFGHLNEQSFVKGTISDEEDVEAGLYAKIENIPSHGPIRREFFTTHGRGRDAVILWLDNDHEGEAISFEVIEYLLHVVKVPPSGCRMHAFFRARFSSPSEALAAMKRLDRPNFKRYLAMVAKHHLDLRVGVPFSRYQKYAARDILKMYIWKLAFGPCSTICAAIIVDRYLRIKDAPLKFCLEYVIDVDGEQLVMRSYPLDKYEANKRYASSMKYNQCQVLEGPEDNQKDFPAPAGLNSFKLMKFQSKYYGRPAVDTAMLAQGLYERGFITYPRSKTTKYPANPEPNPDQLHKNLSRLMRANDIGFKTDMPCDTENVIGKGYDKGDHPPIMPTDKIMTLVDARRFTRAQIEVYHYICRRYLASFMPDYEYCNRAVILDMGADKRLLKYFQTVRPGFTSLFPEMQAATPSESLFAKLVPGAKFKFTVSIKECPRPSLLFEHELITLMEKYNIGTDGSIPNHIAFIEREGYVQINPETRELEPTDLAISMIKGYRTCIRDMIKPEYRAKFIQAIEDIAAGKQDFVTVYNETLREFNDYFKKFQARFLYYIIQNQEELEPLVRQKGNDDMSKAAEEVEALKKLKVVP